MNEEAVPGARPRSRRQLFAGVLLAVGVVLIAVGGALIAATFLLDEVRHQAHLTHDPAGLLLSAELPPTPLTPGERAVMDVTVDPRVGGRFDVVVRATSARGATVDWVFPASVGGGSRGSYRRAGDFVPHEEGPWNFVVTLRPLENTRLLRATAALKQVTFEGLLWGVCTLAAGVLLLALRQF